jgi:AcrR family transcriptional regulator
MSEEVVSRGERTRQAIEEAAYSLFVENGFAGTSMRQIAERSGLALGGIYNHFSSKEEIFRATLVDQHPFWQMLPVLTSASGDNIEEFIQNAATTMIDELGRRPDFVKLMFIEIVEFDGKDFPALFQAFWPKIMPLVTKFQGPAGSLRPVPFPILMRAFIGMFFSYYMTEFMLGDMMPAEMQEKSLDYFVDIFLHGILSEENV